MKKLITVILGIIIMSGCKTTDISPLILLPEDDKYQTIDSLSVTYIAPKNYLNVNEGINGIIFYSYEQTRGSKQQKLYITAMNNSSFEVHRRTDNGAAGSGVIYNVNYTAKAESKAIVLNFKP